MKFELPAAERDRLVLVAMANAKRLKEAREIFTALLAMHPKECSDGECPWKAIRRWLETS
jgi:hypothetical protein